MKISAVIITFNEEKNIGRCIESLQGVVDEIIVVDSFSSDNTEKICLSKGVTFFQNPFEGHIQQKNFAMNQASNDWVLSLDADEALDDQLKKSITNANEDFDAFSMSRLTSYCGKWIKYGGWYPDKKIRLWNRTKGKWGGENPHDRVILSDNVRIEDLKGDLLHYSFYTIEEHINQVQKFTTIAAKAAHENGKKSDFMKRNLGPLFTFLKMYFFKLGFLDGYYGYIIAINSAHYKFLKEVKLRELTKQS